ncbi:ABC transporter permease [Haloarchaeobius salinus]|uniref:ABC transporter permease n=1 Tax=Haloarchaeobius salinus TaxID=1198298 RepID=UPI0021093637|nr:ABC transporter permease subunit [Haloarchaeobius salinus]
MSWRDIAHKDINDAGRSKSIWLLVGILLVLSLGYAYVHQYLGDETFEAFVNGLAGVMALVVPLLAIMLGYKSIVHERTSGSLLLTLSLPHDRRDLAVGTFVGRAVVLLVPTLVALVLAGGFGVVLYGTEGLAMYPWFLLATVLFGLSFVGIAVGLSMSTTRDRWITFGALGGYLLLVNFWGLLHTMTLLILHRFDGTVLLPQNLPEWAYLYRLLEPGQSYYRLLEVGFDGQLASLYLREGAPFYVDWWMGVLLLVLWAVVPMLFGYRRFVRQDI